MVPGLARVWLVRCVRAWLGSALFDRNEEKCNSWTAHCRGEQVGALVAPLPDSYPTSRVGKMQVSVRALFKLILRPRRTAGTRLWVVEHHCLHKLCCAECTEAGRRLEVKSMVSQIGFLKSTAILGKSLHLFALLSSSAKGKQPSCPPGPKVCSGGLCKVPVYHGVPPARAQSVVPASRPPMQLILLGIPLYLHPFCRALVCTFRPGPYTDPGNLSVIPSRCRGTWW